MGVTTVLLSFDFLYFREQTCLIACPYGRFQSVMLDRRILIVTYDESRGEPRGHGKPEVNEGTRSKARLCRLWYVWFRSVRPVSIFAMACRWNASTALSVSMLAIA